ncbi:hypothetical protein HGM15179_016597 [Zosterops borbonicus]|uniref:Uncharacterized protein n=1 Tax=Zosterops borbonicus TaxID=364589 RepID=A0A8K1G2I8_9PASS|nr:hypothetical protein HGM15179_016597 [Zosterops borbonicus]
MEEEVAAEAVPALPSASPVPGAEPEPCPAPAGAAGQEEPPEALAVQEEEKALESPVPSEELPSLGTQSPVPAPQPSPACSPALRRLSRRLSCEIVCRALLGIPGPGRQPEGRRRLEQSTGVETRETATSGLGQSPGPALQRPVTPLPVLPGELREQRPGPAPGSVWAEQGNDEKASDWDSPWDSSSDLDMSQGGYDSDSDSDPDPELFPRTKSWVQKPLLCDMNITLNTGNKHLSPLMEEDEQSQIHFLVELGSSSPMGTEVAAEATPALPNTSPALPNASPASSSALEPEPAAVTPARAAGRMEPPEPLDAQQEEKAVESPVPSEELPSLGTQSPPSVPCNTQNSSSVSLCSDQSSSGQLLSQALLQQLAEQESLEEAAGAAGAAPAQREQSPVPGKSHMEDEHSQQKGVHKAELSQGEKNNSQGGSQGEQELSQEVSDWEECTEEEMSHAEVNNSHEHSDWEEYLEQELLQEPSDWEENMEQELPQGIVKSWEEVSDWEDDTGQAPSQEEASCGHDVSRGNNQRSCTQSSWEDDNDPELPQDPWEVESDSGIWMKPLAPEEDEWDELSILELPPEENKAQKWRVFAADELPVPVPHEAWGGDQAPEPCSPRVLCAWRARLQSRVFVGQASSPVQVLRKRPSRFRRALRGLLGCPCLAAQPEE